MREIASQLRGVAARSSSPTASRPCCAREGLRLPLRRWGATTAAGKEGFLRPTSNWRSLSSAGVSAGFREFLSEPARDLAPAQQVHEFVALAVDCSTSSFPVWRAKAYKSRIDPDRSPRSFSNSPVCMSASAFFAFRIGSGQFRPRASISFWGRRSSGVYPGGGHRGSGRGGSSIHRGLMPRARSQSASA